MLSNFIRDASNRRPGRPPRLLPLLMESRAPVVRLPKGCNPWSGRRARTCGRRGSSVQCRKGRSPAALSAAAAIPILISQPPDAKAVAQRLRFGPLAAAGAKERCQGRVCCRQEAGRRCRFDGICMPVREMQTLRLNGVPPRT